MAASITQFFSQLPCWTSDAVLLERYVHERDEAAFAALVSRHGALVLQLCRRILGDAHAAEDAFQATFLILARKAHSLKQPDALPAWLYGVARRVALKARGQSYRRIAARLDETLLDPHPDPLSQLNARELLDILDEEVQRLPTAQRAAFVLCCLEGHTQEEAARMLGWTPGSVKGRLERGRQRLQTRLQRRGIALSAALTLVVVMRDRAAARVPVLLLQSTVCAAFHGGSGSTASALAQSVLQMMSLTKLAGAIAVSLTLALAASATVLLSYRSPTTETTEDQKPPTPAASEDAKAGKPQARTDALGDPLPDGAIARLGTVRFRHGGFVWFSAFTPDEKRLVSRGIDGLRMWDIATGKELWHRQLGVNTDRRTVDISPDGKRLAVIDRGASNPIEFWDVDSGTKIGSLGAKFRPPIRFSPDGKWLAAASGPTEVELWDLAGKKKLRGWNAHDAPVWAIDFSADSRRLLTSDVMGKVHLWDADSGRKLQEFKPLNFDPAVASPSSNFGPALSADGKLLAILEARVRPSPTPVTDPKACISIWDTATGKLMRQLTCPSRESSPGYVDPFTALVLPPDGEKLVTTGPDRFLRIWDPATGQETRRVPIAGEKRLTPLAFSKDGQTLAGLAGDFSTIRFFDLASGKLKPSPGGDMSGIQSALLTPDGRTAITEGPENSLLVWDATAGQIRRRLQGHETWLRSLQLSADGQTLYSSGGNKTLCVCDLASGEQRKRITVDAGNLLTRLNPIVLPDGKTLIAADSKNRIRVLDMATGQERQHFQLERLCGMIATTDGRSLVGCCCNGMIRLWDVASGRTLRDCPLPVIKEGVQFYSMALSPDARLLAVGSPHLLGAEFPKEHFLLLIDLESGQEVYRREKLPWGVDTLAFSPDGCTLVWAGFEHPVIRLLESANGHERRCLTGHRGAVNVLSFSADGRRLLSGSSDTTALVWDLDDGVRAARSAAEVESLWNDLASDDAARAYRAIRRLAASPSYAIPFVRKHLKPVDAVDEKRLTRLIADLDSDDFASRQKATAELEKLGELALPAYRQALDGKPSLETRRRLEDLQGRAHAAWWDVSGERLRCLRAIEVLELAGTKEAREVLETLVTGAEGARLTEQAKAALKRLQR